MTFGFVSHQQVLRALSESNTWKGKGADLDCIFHFWSGKYHKPIKTNCVCPVKYKVVQPNLATLSVSLNSKPKGNVCL